MNLKNIFLALVAAIALVWNCAPNTKSQIQYWENNKKDFTEAVGKYPAFKAVLDAKMAEADKIWNDAAAITKEEDKAVKMKEANDKLNELLNQFTQIKYKSKSVQDSINKINDFKLASAQDKERNSAAAEALGAINEVEASLLGATAANEEEAKKITGDAISKLISAQGSIDRAIKSVDPKKKK